MQSTRLALGALASPEDRPYGVRDFGFKDPDGHHLVFATRLANFDEAEGRTK